MTKQSDVIEPKSVLDIQQLILEAALDHPIESEQAQILLLLYDLCDVLRTDAELNLNAFNILDRALTEDILHEPYPFHDWKNTRPTTST